MLNLYETFWRLLKSLDLDEKIIQELVGKTDIKLKNPIQGDYPRWFGAYKELPNISSIEVKQYTNAITCLAKISEQQQFALKKSMQELIPWRKGPFEIFQIYIDSEWQSFMKWNRIQNLIPNLNNKRILDVGCGNGYYMFRMAHQKPKLLMGIDPGLLQIMQFWSIEKYVNSGAAVLPIGVQDLPQNMNCFDVVFSMGVLYHRKSPIHHLKELYQAISNTGSLVLETLVIEGDETSCLIPTNRYAQMRNVWFLPSVEMLTIMLKRCGFKNIKCIDVTATTTEEQRTTNWMKFHSLKEFLNDDLTQTIEGYPVPTRATLVACK